METMLIAGKVIAGEDKAAKGDFVHKYKPPLVVSKAHRDLLYTENGSCLLDMEAGNGAVALGYDNTLLQKAVSTISEIPNVPSFCESKTRLKYANKLANFIEGATRKQGKIAFELGGAQGIELAIKIAKRFTHKRKILVFEGGYHGRSFFTSYLSASSRYRVNNDYVDNVVRLPFPDTSSNGIFSVSSYIRFVENILSNEFSGVVAADGDHDICAFLFEPVLNVAGLILPEKEIITYLVERVKDLGGLTIADEIFTGFYRTGKRFGFEHFNISPDLLVSSKIITNGIVPLSAVWGRDPLLCEANFPVGTHSITFGNNVLAFAIANEVLDVFLNNKEMIAKINDLEAWFNTFFHKLQSQFTLVENYRVYGACAALELKKGYGKKFLEALKVAGIEEPVENITGVVVALSSLAPDTIVVKPPFNISLENLELFNVFVRRVLMMYS